ncbi:putative amino acid or sugar ABC transport system, permease protein [Sulfitobacter noctilucicola]|uniref:Rhamnose transport system permease protein n=1 Tax=Sulfitobacter noctilucicola TaxID=1342301 RepID=A0A7W6Q4R4_9RHOB|nr:ABC transporter permease [Sulfitobacter noctilucicola]KIN63580.1 putative amino acid or sugar ABC transport system, permease protein [Sulfitobacter noctilucicola]MBB4174908.1 rhamnose transport system permease protein [Sulfitobacter noctilucicola]
MKRYIPLREAILGAAILTLTLLVASRFPGFIAPSNLANVFNDTAPLIILALGQMVVILTRCIDLSVAANLALTGMAVAMINVALPGLPIPVILTIAVLMGAFMGAINGLLVWKLSIPPIVVTLGTMTIFRGIIFLISDGKWVNSHEMSPAFTGFPRTVLLGLPVLSWVAILTVIVFGIMMARTQSGRSIFAVGGNPHAAVYTGIDVGKTQFWAFVASGALAGLTGYLWVARYAVAYVDIAGGFELEVVAACVIGGISIAGGIGTVGGAVLGAIFLGIVKNALPVVDISPFWQLAISGSAILIAVAFNARSGRNKGRVILKSAEATQ